MKKCISCEEEKELDLFLKGRRLCRSCVNAQRAENYRKLTPEQKEKIRETQKRWQENNPEKRDAIYARYRKTDKRKTANKNWARKNRKKQTDYWRNRYNTDSSFNLKIKLRRRIYMALRKQEQNKSGKTIDLLGCNFEEYKAHIESLFTEGMTWEKVRNGAIHIDHIRPCASFDLSDPEQQKLCFHYTNLQPLWWYDNLLKKELSMEEFLEKKKDWNFASTEIVPYKPQDPV